ncbi:hypothetical protein [Streptomyces decoyicus]|uniref:hypothetical protein n=1 Tax=Streptomyces decoyicus TaxID=249567 RepID=UPI003867B196
MVNGMPFRISGIYVSPVCEVVEDITDLAFYAGRPKAVPATQQLKSAAGVGGS